MGALTNALRRFLSSGGSESAGGLVLASRHYARVSQTWRRAELRTPAAPRAAGASEEAVEAAAAARPDLANWDLPPGLASVVEAEQLQPVPADSQQTRVARHPRRTRPEADGAASEGGAARSAMSTEEMEALLQRLGE